MRVAPSGGGMQSKDFGEPDMSLTRATAGKLVEVPDDGDSHSLDPRLLSCSCGDGVVSWDTLQLLGVEWGDEAGLNVPGDTVLEGVESRRVTRWKRGGRRPSRGASLLSNEGVPKTKASNSELTLPTLALEFALGALVSAHGDPANITPVIPALAVPPSPV